MEEGSDDVVVGHGDVACVGALREVGNRGQKNLGVPIWGGHHEGAFCEGFEQVCTGVVMRVAACGGEKGDEEGRGNREETDGLLEGIEGGGGELELELIQTHMAQKPMLRVEVGALGAHQVKNMRGRAG